MISWRAQWLWRGPRGGDSVAEQVKRATEYGVEIAIVIGAGNIWRGGCAGPGMDRATADYAGMLGTAINAMALQDAGAHGRHHPRTDGIIAMHQAAEPYIPMGDPSPGRAAWSSLARAPNPYFTTDTAGRYAPWRSMPTCCSRRPGRWRYWMTPTNPEATWFDHLSYIEALNMGVKVMDSTALSLCMDNNLPLMVFAEPAR